jgi:CRISPR-associated endonuclease Csn1
MPDRKADGAIHKETLRSARSIEKGVSASKTPITQLKLSKDKSEIEGYDEKAKRDDRLLYEALYASLLQFDGDGEKAFAEPFYKPTADGKQGNPVKKVWTNDKFNTGVSLGSRGVADNGGMVRIDVFFKDGKYYCVPVYLKDIYAKHLPNRAITAGASYLEWTKIDDSFEFLFALFRNDLIYLKAKRSFNLTPSNDKEKQKTSMAEGFLYYKGINIATGAADVITHDNGYEASPYFKTALLLKKYAVDILGEKHEITKEERLNTEWDL